MVREVWALNLRRSKMDTEFWTARHRRALKHFFEKSSVACRRNDSDMGQRKLVASFGAMQRVKWSVWFDWFIFLRCFIIYNFACFGCNDAGYGNQIAKNYFVNRFAKLTSWLQEIAHEPGFVPNHSFFFNFFLAHLSPSLQCCCPKEING